MSLKYEKNRIDEDREKSDLERSPIMRFLRFQDHFKFNVGDILIKQTKSWSHHTPDNWVTEKTSVGAPKKYMYVFENELGIGYIKQLKVDGTGFTTNLVCTANFDPENTRFLLDPDFVDHILIEGDGNFQYNKEYLEKRRYRDNAIQENKKILFPTGSVKKLLGWYNQLKPGDVFWAGRTFDDLLVNKFEILSVKDHPLSAMPSHVESQLAYSGTKYLEGKYRMIEVKCLESENSYQVGKTQITDATHFIHRKVTMQQPFPLEDALCGQQK
jgi:hypothetical protein